MYTGDVQPITLSAGAPVSVTLRLPTDRRNGIKADTGMFAQDRWALGRMTLNLGIRYDWFIGETQPEDLLAGRFNVAQHFDNCADGKNDPKAGCTGTVQNWKDISPRVGVAYDVFGNGRTAVKASVARYVAGEAIATANAANPITALGLTDTRTWRDLDSNGSPFDANGNVQLGELTASNATPTFGKNVSTTTTDPGVLNGWGKRGYNWEYTVSAQHQIAARMSVNGGYYRRTFGNQTFTDDLRYDQSSYDGPFCITTPADSLLPGGGNYQVCNLYDLKQSVINAAVAREQLDPLLERLRRGNQPLSGIRRQPRRASSQRGVPPCGLGRDGPDVRQLQSRESRVRSRRPCWRRRSGTETYADGTSYCHREYPFRPDFKASGSYTLPYDIQLSWHLPVQPRRADRRRGSEHPGELDARPGGLRAGRRPERHADQFDPRPRAEHRDGEQDRSVDARRVGVRRQQPESAGHAGVEAGAVRPLQPDG